ncbi:MAG: hypothetical protein ACJAU6_002072 [Alphaproteobacteria bacterium]
MDKNVHMHINEKETIMEKQYESKLWTAPRVVLLGAVASVQFIAAYVIGTGRYLTNDASSFFAPIALTAAAPVVIFLAIYAGSASFRNFILAQDFRFLTAIHLWRVVGFSFLAFYAFDMLPAVFALSAGIGDVAVGLAAIFVLARLDRDPDYAATSGFLRFHALGLFDFVAAISTAGLTAGVFPALIPNGVTSALMDVWPLNIFPSFIVPAFIILQLTALFKIHHLRRTVVAPAGAIPDGL